MWYKNTAKNYIITKFLIIHSMNISKKNIQTFLSPIVFFSLYKYVQLQKDWFIIMYFIYIQRYTIIFVFQFSSKLRLHVPTFFCQLF